MNYLQLCQAVRSRIGLHGTGPASVTAPTDVEQDIVDAVKDAWLDIQNYREEWDWMRATVTFNTAVGTTNYTKTTMAGPSNRISRFIKDSFWLYTGSEYKKLRFMEEEPFEELTINSSENKEPSIFTINRNEYSIELESPDDIYALTLDYWKVPQVLSANTDTPEIPSQWHNLIVYLAVQKLSASIASQSTAAEFGQAYAVMMGQLMRTQLKKKTMKVKGIA